MPVPWYVYVVANHTQEELYIGVVKDRGTIRRPAGPIDSVESRWIVHCAGDTAAVGHWNCKTDDLELICHFTFDNQPDASDFAHDLERTKTLLRTRCPEAAKLHYRPILTSGI